MNEIPLWNYSYAAIWLCINDYLGIVFLSSIKRINQLSLVTKAISSIEPYAFALIKCLNPFEGNKKTEPVQSADISSFFSLLVVVFIFFSIACECKSGDCIAEIV